VVAVVNDTVGTMMSCGYDDPRCEIGLIVGEDHPCPQRVTHPLAASPPSLATGRQAALPGLWWG